MGYRILEVGPCMCPRIVCANGRSTAKARTFILCLLLLLVLLLLWWLQAVKGGGGSRVREPQTTFHGLKVEYSKMVSAHSPALVRCHCEGPGGVWMRCD